MEQDDKYYIMVTLQEMTLFNMAWKLHVDDCAVFPKQTSKTNRDTRRLNKEKIQFKIIIFRILLLNKHRVTKQCYRNPDADL